MKISELIFPRPVVIVTVAKEDKINGMAASFVSPISFNPMYVGVSIAPTRYTFEVLKETKEFGICVLEENQIEISERFGRYSGREINKFEGIEWFWGKKIRVPLIKCPVAFECVLEDMRQYGDHYWVVGKVVEVHIFKKDFKPLLHKTGKTYMRALEI